MDLSRLPQYPGEGTPGQPSARRPSVSPAVEGAVEAAVDVFLAHPEADQDGMLTALREHGFPPRDAWRLYQFVPIAFTHVLLRGRGIDFQPGYETLDPETGARTNGSLRDEPIYAAAVRSARRRAARGVCPIDLLPVFGHSAEWDLICQLYKPGGSLGGIWLTEPLLIEFRDEAL